jgi:hypothetical protein
MIKLVRTSDTQWNEKVATLLKVTRFGAEFDGMLKTAGAVLAKEFSELKPSEKYAWVHTLAIGSTEAYGPNRNADGFAEDWLKKKHGTFTKNANLFRNHANKDPKKAIGIIKHSAYNPEMRRVELIVGYDKRLASDIVEKLANDEDIAGSMGCVLDPEYPVLTKTGYKRIADIAVGDEVLTGKGRWRKVTELRNRRYTGKVVTLKVNGLPMELPLTANHPMMAKAFAATYAAAGRAYASPAAFEDTPWGWCHAEHLGKGDHIQFVPAQYPREDYAAIDSVALARLMGFYVAEGSFGYNGDTPRVIEFTCNLDDDLPRIVPGLMSELFPGTTCTIKPRANSKAALGVYVFSTAVACFMDKYLGHRAENKFVPPEIFVASEEVRLAFLGAWLSGDGFVDKKGVHWSSCNLRLVLQARDLLASLGIPASIYKITHKAGSGFSTTDTVEYTLNISAMRAERLLPYAERKLAALASYLLEQKRAGWGAIRANEDGTLSYRLDEVVESEVVDAPIYNFEVEEDQSYTLAGMVSHNCRIDFDVCSICGNKAPSPKQYCNHMKMAAAQILDDGRQVFVDNPDPNFFDWSYVGRPADRVAFSFAKVAHASDGAWKSAVDLAQEVGLWLPEHIARLEGQERRQLKLAMLRKLSEMEKEVPAKLTPIDTKIGDTMEDSALDDSTVSRLKKADLGETMGALHNAQVILPVKDFLKLVANKKDEDIDDIGDDVQSQLPGVFGRMLDDEDDSALDNNVFDGGECCGGPIMDLVQNLIPSLGLGAGPLGRRVTITVIRGRKKKASSAAQNNPLPEIETLARLYATYKLAAVTHPRNERDAMLTRAALLQNYHHSI